jgi:trans-aconitate methyltransferase
MTTWKFDNSVADRFQHEANTHIPDYQRVIELCVQYCDNYYTKNSAIIDVGSALGHTLYSFTQLGFTNISGVESSTDMIEKSFLKQNVICSDAFPSNNYDVVLMNWTLHFIQDKLAYLQSVYDNLNHNGTLILTDKVTQSTRMKEMYYNFKRNNGVSDEYILEKEARLRGYMHTENVQWYIDSLQSVGFTVEILSARFNFVTFLCYKE